MKRTVFVLLGLLVASVVNAESYVCVTEAAAGMKFRSESNTWYSTTFNPDGKYLIKPFADDTAEKRWTLRLVGGNLPIAHCYSDFDADGRLYCDGKPIGNDWDFRFNRNTSRFLFSYFVGYWNETSVPEETNTPMMEIGKCSRID